LVQGYAINKKQPEVLTLKDGIRMLSRSIEEKKGESHLVGLNQFTKAWNYWTTTTTENWTPKAGAKSRLYISNIQEYQKVVEAIRQDFYSEVFGIGKYWSFRCSAHEYWKNLAIKKSCAPNKKFTWAWYNFINI